MYRRIMETEFIQNSSCLFGIETLVRRCPNVLIKIIHNNIKQTKLKTLIKIKSLTFGDIIYTEGAVDESASYWYNWLEIRRNSSKQKY